MMPLFLPRSLCFISASLVLGAVALPGGSPPERWQMDSFRAFAEGSLPDGGVNIYTAANGTVRLINAFDLNLDGLPDIFLPCNHAYGEKVDLSIYWDQPGYSKDHVARLPTEGGEDAAVSDLNRDGFPDLIVVNSFDGTKNELSAYIYWGSPRGYSPDHRSLLPTQGGEAVSVADLNDDGWPDLVIANNGRTYHVAVDKIQESYIYWNRQGQFAAEHKTILPTINGRDAAIADLNQDGAPDIVLVSAGNEAGEAGARIYWSRNGSFAASHSMFLPGEGSGAVTIADLNRDGRPDVILVNSERLKGREGGIYNIVDTVQLDSFIYWNSATGFDPAKRTGLPTVAGSDAATGDLDLDGWPEIIFANGKGDASFVYWGSPEGYQTRRRIALPTNNARAVLAADLNKDGNLDLVFANFSLGHTFDTDSFIYWGSPKGPTAQNRQNIPTSGASAVIASDLRQQGRSDLIFMNKQDGTGAQTPASLYLSDRRNPAVFSPDSRIDVDTSGPDTYSSVDVNLDGYPDLIIPGSDGVSIMWGGENHFQGKERTQVFSNYASSTRLADFNRDGYLDLISSEWSPGSNETHLYYGSPAGFSPASRTAFPIGGCRFHTIADFNGDGWLDVAFPLFSEEKVCIFWNGPTGFQAANRTDLPGRSSVALEAADLNRDGFIDLIVPNLFDKNPPPESKTRSFGGSPDGGVFIYWGQRTGFSNTHRTVLPALGAEDAAVADFNNDGTLDLAISSYHGGSRRDLPSYIYWQGPQGFEASNVTRLETYSASGILATDFNADGWMDLFFANHQRNGNHRTDSFLYWGGPNGYVAEHRLDLPSRGTHLMTVTDHGNISDRQHDYHYISPAKELVSAEMLRAISWSADTPPGTSLRFQLRSATTFAGLADAPWEGPAGHNTYFHTALADTHLGLKGRWVQFRATLSNPGGGLPVLKSVSLTFD